MTREEELERKQARNRKDYESRKEYYKRKSKEWYWRNRDYALQKGAALRQRKREEAHFTPKIFHRSIESLEQDLPVKLRHNTTRLREDFLRIPILERPPYDVFLKLKTIEYLKTQTT